MISPEDLSFPCLHDIHTFIHSFTLFSIYPYSGVPRNFVWGGGSTNSVEDRGQRERGSGGGSPLVRVLEAAVICYKKFHFL